MISVESRGDFEPTRSSLKKLEQIGIMDSLHAYGQRGVSALASNTPTDTGATAAGWFYEIKKTPSGYAIEFHNRNVVDGANIAVLIQYGHATGTGAYIQGRDYMSPVLNSIFTEMGAQITRALKT